MGGATGTYAGGVGGADGMAAAECDGVGNAETALDTDEKGTQEGQHKVPFSVCVGYKQSDAR